MASYTPKWAKTATLVASTVDTVTLQGRFAEVEVLNHGAVGITFTVDGVTPTVEGDDMHVLPASAGASLRVTVRGNAGTTAVKLISSGTPKYTVTGVNS